MSTELKDVLSVCRKIRGNTHETGAHYLLGYIWATVPKEKQQEIYETFIAEVEGE